MHRSSTCHLQFPGDVSTASRDINDFVECVLNVPYVPGIVLYVVYGSSHLIFARVIKTQDSPF